MYDLTGAWHSSGWKEVPGSLCRPSKFLPLCLIAFQDSPRASLNVVWLFIHFKKGDDASSSCPGWNGDLFLGSVPVSDFSLSWGSVPAWDVSSVWGFGWSTTISS